MPLEWEKCVHVGSLLYWAVILIASFHLLCRTYSTNLNPGECFAPFSDRGIGINRPRQSDQSIAGMQQR